MKRTVSPLAVSLAAIATFQLAPAAYAADAATAAEAADVEGDAADAGNNDTGLVDIVVTATKRETNLQETPIAVSVLGDEEIKKRHVESLLDLADGGIPSLRVNTKQNTYNNHSNKSSTKIFSSKTTK